MIRSSPRHWANYATPASLVLAATLLAGCGSSSPAAETSTSSSAAGSSSAADPTGSSATSAASGDLTTVRWIYDYFPTAADLPILAAQANGYFTANGLDVQTTPGGSVNQLQDVGIGQHDITVGPGVDLIQSVTQELPIESIGVVQPNNPSGLLCSPDVGLDAADPTTLIGHPIGVTTNNVVDVAVWNAYKAKYGLEGKVTEIEIGDDITPLFSGQVDCFPAFLTQLPAVAEQNYGKAPVVYNVNTDVETVGQVLMANTDFAAAQPAAVSGFVDAYAKGMQWTIDNQADALVLLEKTYPDYDVPTAEAELPALTKLWHASLQDTSGLLVMDDTTWKPSVDLLVSGGLMDSAPEMSQIYTTEFLPATPVLP